MVDINDIDINNFDINRIGALIGSVVVLVVRMYNDDFVKRLRF